VKNIRAAVLLAHGLNDYNVVPEHTVRIYDEMRARRLPVSMFLHQGGHGGDPPFDMLNRWFSHYLYGIDNGVEKDARVWIDTSTVRRRRGRGQEPAPPPPPPLPFASFPVPGSVPVVFHPTSGGRGLASLSTRASARGADTLVDDVAFSGADNALATESPHRLLYATPELTEAIRVSGTPRVTLRVAASAPAANLSVWLVTLPYDTTRVGSQSQTGVVSRGWADIRNHGSLTRGGNYDSKLPGEPLVPGRFYDVTFDLQPTDEIVPPGKRLAVMIMSSDREFTLWPRAGTTLTIDLARSSFSIPIVGGATRFGAR
jgi:X-Pro dipeptidyl-peptidase